MANRGTITYNGKTISTEDRDGSFAVYYDGIMKANIAAGHSQTLNCAGKLMKTNVVIGGKTLNCAKYKMATDVVIAVVSLFPSSPSSYNLLSQYTASNTWTAPEDGYYQIEVFGASGSGGLSFTYNPGSTTSTRKRYGGGGGGGGGYSCSRVKMNKGDTIVLNVGAIGATTSAIINSSYDNSYDHTIQVTSGISGTNAGNTSSSWFPSYSAGIGGAGGTASGGNYQNANGSAGTDGASTTGNTAASGGVGGAAGYTGGNAGGDGANSTSSSSYSKDAEPGSAGVIKIYRGNTN